jgi:hypothetical protein
MAVSSNYVHYGTSKKNDEVILLKSPAVQGDIYHSFCSLYYDSSVASSKASFKQGAI